MKADPSLFTVDGGIVIEVSPDRPKERSPILFSFDESSNLIVVVLVNLSKFGSRNQKTRELHGRRGHHNIV
jgi:hypothetical protein